MFILVFQLRGSLFDCAGYSLEFCGSGRPAAFIRARSAITTVLPSVAASARVWPRWCMSKHDSIELEKPIVSMV